MNRLLERTAAAEYIGVSQDELRHVPIKPVRLRRNDGRTIRKVLYDRNDLDRYINSCKGELCQNAEPEATELVSSNQAAEAIEFNSRSKASSTAKQLKQTTSKPQDQYSATVLQKWKAEYP